MIAVKIGDRAVVAPFFGKRTSFLYTILSSFIVAKKKTFSVVFGYVRIAGLKRKNNRTDVRLS